VCVFKFRYPARDAHAQYFHLWPLRLYYIFAHYLINVKTFEGEKYLLKIYLDNDPFDVHFFCFTVRPLQSSTFFKLYMLIIRRLNCIDAAYVIVTLSQWPSGVPDGH